MIDDVLALQSSEHVARAVLFLCSPEAEHITGTELWIDGGESLIGINHYHVRECPKSDRCTVSRRDFGRIKRRNQTFSCTLCGLIVTAEQVDC